MPRARSKRNTGPWSSQRILSSSSPVISKDIHGFLVQCISGWNANYDENERKTIIDRMPPAYRKYNLDDDGRLQCPLSLDFVFDDSRIKAAVVRFKSDLSDGYYDKTWQTQAKKAMDDRRHGKFEEHLRNAVEEHFGATGQDGNAKLEAENEAVARPGRGEWCDNTSI